MKIAFCLHFSMPFRCAGSETVAHELARAAAAAGHEVRVWATHKDAEHNWRGSEPDVEYDGLTIHRSRNVLLAGAEIQRWRPDVVVSHHDHATYSIRLAKRMGARSVFLTHNEFDLNGRPLKQEPSLVIHNSDWVRDSLNRKFGPDHAAFVFHPPLTPDRHLTTGKGESITLINMNADKGAETFYALAQRMPDRSFIAVEGGHGKQVIRKLPNVTHLEHGPDMKRVWAQTRILLMPSVAESYGLTAVEAGINGIPTIAHPTPGLKENLGAGGLFADRDKLNQWVRKITLLDDPANYQQASEYASDLARSAMDATRDTLKQWTEWISTV